MKKSQQQRGNTTLAGSKTITSSRAIPGIASTNEALSSHRLFFIHHTPLSLFDPVIKLLKKSLLLAIFAGIITIVRVKNTTFTPHGFTQFNMCSLEQEVSVWQQITTTAVLHFLWNSTSMRWMS